MFFKLDVDLTDFVHVCVYICTRSLVCGVVFGNKMSSIFGPTAILFFPEVQ